MRSQQHPYVARWWQHPEVDDDVAEYRQLDHEHAMQEIQSLVDRVDRGDLRFSLNEGFFIPKDYSLVDLWRNDDGYHSMFPKRGAVPRKNWGRTQDMKREENNIG